jgi:hypothetical protein
MLRDLMLRKASFFAKKEWKLDWHDPEQRLYDLGFDLAALLEDGEAGVCHVQRCNNLHRSLEDLSKDIWDGTVELNLLACKLLLCWVAKPLGLLWSLQGSVIADAMLNRLNRTSLRYEAQRYIFPLTCLEWHYRQDLLKSGQVAALKAAVVHEGKVAVAGSYDVQSTVPRFARV